MVHFVCSGCEKLSEGTVWEKSFSTKKYSCQTASCQSELIPFITFDLMYQLKSILSINNIDQIKKNVNKAKLFKTDFNCAQSIFDTMQAESYQRFIKSFNGELVLSFILNTDGASLTVSKNYSMWPIFGTILELNPTSREKFINVVLLGINISKFLMLFKQI